MTQPINILGVKTVLGSTAKMGVRRSIEGVTRLIGRDEKFKVTMDVTFDNTVTASTAYKRNKRSIRGTVSLPCVADDQHIPEELYNLLLGYTCHEILHPLLSGWEEYQTYGVTYGHDVVNMVEDVCIEVINHWKRWQPGGEKFLGICKARMVGQSYDEGWMPETISSHSEVAWAVKVLGIAKLCEYPEVEQYIGMTETRLIPSGHAARVEDIVAALSQLCKEHITNPIGGYALRMAGLELILKKFFGSSLQGPAPTNPQPPTNPKPPTNETDEDEDDTTGGDPVEDDADEDEDDTNGGEGEGEGEDGDGEEDDDDGGDTGGGDSEDGDDDDDDDDDVHGDPIDTNGGESGNPNDDPEAGDGNSEGKNPFTPPTEHDELLEKAKEEFMKANEKLRLQGLDPTFWREVQLPVRILTVK